MGSFLTLRNKSGNTAFLQVSCTEWKNTFSFEIYGKNGKLEINGLGGSYGNLLKIKEICRKKKIKLIIDAAHMAGSYNGNKHIGSEGDVSIFSFQAVKNLPSADSGIICFRDKK